ncbi:MAG: WD40 repeat domain-containing protein, partial [Phycisphaerales bacterium]
PHDRADHGRRAPAPQVEWAPRGAELAVVCIDGSCATLGVDGGELRRRALAVPAAQTSLEAPHAFARFVGNAGRLVVGARGGARVAFIEADGAVGEVDLSPRRVESLAAVGAGAGAVLVGCDDGRIVVLGADPASPARTIDAHNGAVYALAVDAEGVLVASSGGDSTVRLWNIAEGRAVGAVRAIEGGARALEIAPLGVGDAQRAAQLVAAAPDGSLRFFPLAAAALESDLVVGGTGAPLAAFLPDGTIVTAPASGNHAITETETTRRSRVGGWPLDASLEGAALCALLAPTHGNATRRGAGMAVVGMSAGEAARAFVADHTGDGAWQVREAGVLGEPLAARLLDGRVAVASRLSG